MKKIAALLNILVIAGLFYACATPPETPGDNGSSTENTSNLGTSNNTENVDALKNPVSDEEVSLAKNAIARAEEVDAATYDPVNLEAAKVELVSAEGVKDTDPDKARGYLASSIEKADKAFETSKVALTEKYLKVLYQNDEKLLEIEADLFEPDSYNSIKAAIVDLKDEFESDDFTSAKNKADSLIDQMSRFYDGLNEKIIWVRILKEDVEKNIQTAEEKSVYLWAADDLDQVNKLYFDGIEALSAYKLSKAEENFGSAKELSLSLLNPKLSTRPSEATKNLKEKVLKMLKDASMLTVITEDGDVIEPDPIDIDAFVDSIRNEIESEQKQDQSDTDSDTEGDNTSMIFLDDEVYVLGDVESESLYQQAKELIRLAIIEENKGNYEYANDYLTQAEGYLIAYQALAVNNIYTVRLIPDRRDCLWRIAEYPNILDDPYLWPLIWRRNRKAIQNPNLIYPGQKLVIPPKPEPLPENE
ncbi:MAG: DUF4398 domain-containing protein [Spirochaetales bacterium]|nr:DUF4398 domain-containing protein [Spirochaetales bacterium]